MALDSNIRGVTSGLGAEVAGANQLKIIPETDATSNPTNIGGVRTFSENDQGLLTGVVDLRSPEIDADYRIRVASDIMLDDEVFNYTAQNTGKHIFNNITMANTWTAGQMTTNSGNITTISTGTQFETRACFPMMGTSTLSSEFALGFSAQPQTNSFIEFGHGVAGTSLVAPSDGAFFRLSSAGLQGIASSNGTETSTGIFPLANGTGIWSYINSTRYQFVCYSSVGEVLFWVNDGTSSKLLGRIPQPLGQGRVFMSSGVSLFVKHRIAGGAAGGVLQCLVGGYNVRSGSGIIATTPSTAGSRIMGSYQGLSGGTMGGLTTYPNSTNPIAAVPTNTALTANLPGGLGGQGLVTTTGAAVLDGIWSSYQLPTNNVNVQGRRLVIRGIRLDAVNIGAAVATTATTLQFSLAYGHTAVSLQTGEGPTTKAPRRLALGFMTWPVGAGIGAQPQLGALVVDLGDAPVFVNPGEFIALVCKFVVGTATALQVIQFTYQPIYGWE